MSTDGERSILSLFHGGQALPGYVHERARPDLRNSPSGNYGPTAELTDNLIALRDHDEQSLAESALRWERHLAPGEPGVAMRIEPNSSTYVPWIVLPVDGMYHVMLRTGSGQLAAERAHWWLRAWLTVAALGMATVRGKLIDDETDPAGEARPGPVFARAEVDREPWTGSPYQRRNRGILPSVLCGERAWQRSYPPQHPDDDYRLCRSYLDQSQHSQIAMLALHDNGSGDGLDWQGDASDDGDWPVRYQVGLSARFGVPRVLACLTDEERANIKRAWQSKSVEDVKRVLPYLDGWFYDRTLILAAHDNGSLWMLCTEGGRTSTASTEAATFDALSRESGWLAANNGMRDADEKSDDIVATRGWEDGDRLCAERSSDGRYGVRKLLKPSGREIWRLVLSRDENRLCVPGQPDRLASGAAAPPSSTPPHQPPPEEPTMPEPTDTSPAGDLAGDGNPFAYHTATHLVTQTLTTLVTQCVGRCQPDAAQFLAGLLREQADRLAPKR